MEKLEQPHKSAGFNTGVPAPAGAGLAFVPVYLWLIAPDLGQTALGEWARSWPIVMGWTLFIALLMISNLPTFSWSSIRIRRSARLFALAFAALLVAALVLEPWWTLLGISALYLFCLPLALASYAKVKRRRAGAGRRTPDGAPEPIVR
jgi:CDP-diacylglycerol--serine O-phosphatidyltransferase